MFGGPGREKCDALAGKTCRMNKIEDQQQSAEVDKKKKEGTASLMDTQNQGCYLKRVREKERQCRVNCSHRLH